MDKKYYRVCAIPGILPDFHEYGYEDEHSFYRGLYMLNSRYRGRVGEYRAERHAFLLLRFVDTPDRQSVEEWMPKFILEPAAPPDIEGRQMDGQEDAELDKAFGFD